MSGKWTNNGIGNQLYSMKVTGTIQVKNIVTDYRLTYVQFNFWKNKFSNRNDDKETL